MNAIAMGVHVLDTLVRPVEEIPAGQGGALVEEIRMTAAGSAGGSALILAKLGARVQSAGAIGSDPIGEQLVRLLERDGVETGLLLRRDDVQTSASVLPIRPNGERPAFHVVGANGTYGPDDAPWEAIAGATHLHLGGPEFMGGEAAAQILARAREQGVVTSADVLAPGDPGLLEWIAPALPHLDYLLPNDEQVLGFTGATDVAAGCRHWSSGAPAAWRRPAVPTASSSSMARASPASPPSRSKWSTRPAAATPSQPASSAASASAGRASRQQRWDAR